MVSAMCSSVHLVEKRATVKAAASPPRPLVITGLGQVPRDESLISKGQKHTSIISGNGEFASSSRAAAIVVSNDSHRRFGQLHHV